MDWMSLIYKFADAFLLKCFDEFSSETPQEYLPDFYDANTGKLDPWVVRKSMPAVRQGIFEARQSLGRKERRDLPKYNRRQIYDMTETRLILAMTSATEEQVAAAREFGKTLTVATTFGDDD